MPLSADRRARAGGISPSSPLAVRLIAAARSGSPSRITPSHSVIGTAALQFSAAPPARMGAAASRTAQSSASPPSATGTLPPKSARPPGQASGERSDAPSNANIASRASRRSAGAADGETSTTNSASGTTATIAASITACAIRKPRSAPPFSSSLNASSLYISPRPLRLCVKFRPPARYARAPP